MIDAHEVTAVADPERTAARRRIVDSLIDLGAVAVVRLADASYGEPVAAALLAGGVRAIEITFTTSGAIDLIASLSKRFGDALLIGAGSVLDVETAQRAIDAGARYIVSPVFDAAVLAAAHACDIPALPGAFTPTEILRAQRSGADLVKLFPADALTPAYLKGVLAPMPFLEVMPTGGVTPDNAVQWITAGAVAVGLGSALVDPTLVRSGDFDTIAERARTTVAGIAAARAQRNPP